MKNKQRIYLTLQKINELLIQVSPGRLVSYVIPLKNGDDESAKKKIETLKEIQRTGAIKIFHYQSPVSIVDRKGKKIIRRQQKYLISIKTLMPRFKEVYNYYKEKQESKLERVKEFRKEKIKSLINRDEKTGDFYFKNKPIKFGNKDTIYYLIFECLYEKGNLEGFCSYETINKYLVEHGKDEYADHRQITDRIKNGIINLFRFSNLPPKALVGKEIIQKIRGKGIILYNPSL